MTTTSDFKSVVKQSCCWHRDLPLLSGKQGTKSFVFCFWTLEMFFRIKCSISTDTWRSLSTGLSWLITTLCSPHCHAALYLFFLHLSLSFTNWICLIWFRGSRVRQSAHLDLTWVVTGFELGSYRGGLSFSSNCLSVHSSARVSFIAVYRLKRSLSVFFYLSFTTTTAAIYQASSDFIVCHI